MDSDELRRTMIRYLEYLGIWSEIVPVVLGMVNQTPDGLVELAFYVLDQGRGLTQKKLVDKAMSIWRTAHPDAA